MMYWAFVGILVSTLACQTPKPEESQSASSGKNEDQQETLYAVSFDKAKGDVIRYDSISRVLFNKEPIKAFTIRSIDLLEAMGMPLSDTTLVSYQHVRVYLGLDSNYNFKLFLNPVDSANLSANPPRPGVDVFLSGNFGELGSQSGEYVLDFTQPCPTTCPPDPFGR